MTIDERSLRALIVQQQRMSARLYQLGMAFRDSGQALMADYVYGEARSLSETSRLFYEVLMTK